MKKTLITAVTIAACAAMQLPAQNVKQGNITFALTQWTQTGVSTTTPATGDAGLWSEQPMHYSDGSIGNISTTGNTSANGSKNILQCISYVIHPRNPNYYSSNAKLVLVQGELSGFFNMVLNEDDTGLPYATVNTPSYDGFAPYDLGNFDASPYGTVFTDTSLGGQQNALFVALATGRHLLPNPIDELWAPGHHQPWGQIYVKDPGVGNKYLNDPICDNVTFLFAITVEECYDCFYLNSFISQANFTYQRGSRNGPPCCFTPAALTGSGVDKYYMSLSFDNTSNNPYLNTNSPAWVGHSYSYYDTGVKGIDYLVPNSPPNEGITPDDLDYVDEIASGVRRPSPYEMRFTLQGILTYTWSLKLINPKTDAFADFVGTANFAANGFGFIALRCTLLTGTMGIAETLNPSQTCCNDDPWYDWWYGIGWNGPSEFNGIDGGITEDVQDPWYDWFASPINTPTDLSFHTSFDQDYYPGWEWLTNPQYYTSEPTVSSDTYVPIWSAPYCDYQVPFTAKPTK